MTPPNLESPLEKLPSGAKPRDLVVLTHGIASSRLLLVPLAQRLRAQGFDTRLHGYLSIWGSNTGHGHRFAGLVQRLARQHPGRTIHIVAHSMGSIVTRCAIQAGLPESVGKIVMIGPPNRGSVVAHQMSRFLGWFSPTLSELSHEPHSFVNQLPASIGGHPLGVVIAARDNVVQPQHATLDQQDDQIVIDGFHTGVLWQQETADCVGRFLRTGRFRPSEQPPVCQAGEAMPQYS